MMVHSLVRENEYIYETNFKINKMDWSFNKFCENFANAIDEENVNKFDFNTRFEDIDDWDSFAIMSTIAMLDLEYGIIVSGEEISKMHTLGQLFEFIKLRNE